ncbi:sugar phosphate isomerase/epimerase family protein [Candidatus Latescibacterota bacterium]
MKIAGCWMYVINKYGFPPKLENMRKGIKELSDLGFDYIELEVVGKANLMEVMNNRSNLLEYINMLEVSISNFAVLLPNIYSMNKSLKDEALSLFDRGIETAEYLKSDNVWIDSFMPPLEVKEGKVFSETIEFGTELKVKIPPDFIWSEFWDNFVDSVKKCNQIAEKYHMPLLIEPRTGEVIANTDALLRIIDVVNSENLGVIFDTAHLHAAKEILPLSIEKLGNNIKYVHAGDNDGSSDRHLLPGDGTIDWEEIFLGLGKIGFEGYFATDLEALPDYDQSFLKCKKFLEDSGKKYSL